MYGKVFESIFDSTLIAEGGWLPTYIFMSMISMADKDGYVEIAPRVLYSKLGFRDYDAKIEYKDFLAALDYLCEPDSYSKSEDFNGCRIIPITELTDIQGGRGWWIVNYKQYRDRAAREDRAAQSTTRSQKWRAKHKNSDKIKNGTQGDAKGREGRHTDTDTDTDTDNTASFDAFWSLYQKKVDKKRAQTAWNKLSLSIQQQAIADIETRYQGIKKQFIPNPTTYISGERWNDESGDSEEEDSIFKIPERSIQ